MKNCFILRVLIDTTDTEDVFRDLLIPCNSNFESLHSAILSAFKLEEGQMASFYLSDDDWNKGEEIALFDMGEGNIRSMQSTLVSDVITEKEQKLLYVYDFLNMWCFYIEVLETKAQKEIKEVETLLSVGLRPEKSPNQTDEPLSENQMISDFDQLLKDEFGDDDIESEEYNDFENFENIDDLDI